MVWLSLVSLVNNLTGVKPAFLFFEPWNWKWLHCIHTLTQWLIFSFSRTGGTPRPLPTTIVPGTWWFMTGCITMGTETFSGWVLPQKTHWKVTNESQHALMSSCSGPIPWWSVFQWFHSYKCCNFTDTKSTLSQPDPWTLTLLLSLIPAAVQQEIPSSCHALRVHRLRCRPWIRVGHGLRLFLPRHVLPFCSVWRWGTGSLWSQQYLWLGCRKESDNLKAFRKK